RIILYSPGAELRHPERPERHSFRNVRSNNLAVQKRLHQRPNVLSDLFLGLFGIDGAATSGFIESNIEISLAARLMRLQLFLLETIRRCAFICPLAGTGKACRGWYVED